MNSEILKKIYALLAELWCSPIEWGAAKEQTEELLSALEDVDPSAAESIRQFLSPPIAEEEYVALFELDPLCPLYLGSHVFEEPKTCAQAAISDRNSYMLELVGIYGHFGLTLNGRELPDYLPLMVEFLALTAGRDDPVRTRFVQEYLLSFLPPLRSRLVELNTPYVHLLDALERIITLDVGTTTAEVIAHV